MLESRTYVIFSEDGEASGFGRCNNYAVSYEGDLQVEKVMESTVTDAELSALTFGPIAGQLAECAEFEGIMEQEQGSFNTLGAVAYYFKIGFLRNSARRAPGTDREKRGMAVA